MVFERNSHSGKRICEDKREVQKTFSVEITHTYSHLTTLLVLILLLVKDNDFPTEMRAFNIKAKKRDLGKAKREIRKKVAELKEVREGGSKAFWITFRKFVCFGTLTRPSGSVVIFFQLSIFEARVRM